MAYSHELEVARSLALEAGERLRSVYRERIVRVGAQELVQVVTIPDLIADDVILSGLREAFPNDAVCSEQSPLCWDRYECDRVWLVDALDGVSSYMSGNDDCAISIGLSVNGQPVVGVVYNPIRDELFYGSSEQPLMVEGIEVDDRDDSMPRISVPRQEWQEIFENIPEVVSLFETRSIAYELARVAAGIRDGFFTLANVREWTTCAGAALLRSAKVFACLLDGEHITYNNEELRHRSGIIAARTCAHLLAIDGILHLPSVVQVSDNIRRRERRAA